VLRSCGDAEAEAVVGRIRGLVAVEHSLLSENVDQRRRKHGDRHLERLGLHEVEADARERDVTELRASLGNPTFVVREAHGRAERAAAFPKSIRPGFGRTRKSVQTSIAAVVEPGEPIMECVCPSQGSDRLPNARPRLGGGLPLALC